MSALQFVFAFDIQNIRNNQCYPWFKRSFRHKFGAESPMPRVL